MSNESTTIKINIKSLIDNLIIINTSETNSPEELANLIKQKLSKVALIASEINEDKPHHLFDNGCSERMRELVIDELSKVLSKANAINPES